MPATNALNYPIEIADWREDEEFGIHPYGSKAKRTVLCPAEATHPMLIPGHRYLFKQAENWKGQQMWSEALAYQLGAAMDLPVPPCFLATNSADQATGALIEFFYGYPGDERSDRLEHGADVLQGAGLMDGSGQPHFVTTNLAFCETAGIDQPADWWARVLAFDALIGNTDRHSQNWGFLVDQEGVRRMAPMFDNGTSMAYQIADAAIDGGLTDQAVEQFVRKGRHNLRWSADDTHAYDHVALCRRYAEQHPETAPRMMEAIAVGDEALAGFLQACVDVEVRPRFTAGRAEVVGRLIRMRRDLLVEALGPIG